MEQQQYAELRGLLEALSKQHAEHAAWVHVKLTSLEDAVIRKQYAGGGPAIRQVGSFAFQPQAANASIRCHAGFEAGQTATGPVNLGNAGSSGRLRSGRYGRTRRMSDSSQATSFQDALERFGSATGSSAAWSDTDSLYSRDTSVAVLDGSSLEGPLQFRNSRLSSGAEADVGNRPGGPGFGSRIQLPPPGSAVAVPGNMATAVQQQHASPPLSTPFLAAAAVPVAFDDGLGLPRNATELLPHAGQHDSSTHAPSVAVAGSNYSVPEASVRQAVLGTTGQPTTAQPSTATSLLPATTLSAVHGLPARAPASLSGIGISNTAALPQPPITLSPHIAVVASAATSPTRPAHAACHPPSTRQTQEPLPGVSLQLAGTGLAPTSPRLHARMPQSAPSSEPALHAGAQQRPLATQSMCVPATGGMRVRHARVLSNQSVVEAAADGLDGGYDVPQVPQPRAPSSGVWALGSRKSTATGVVSSSGGIAIRSKFLESIPARLRQGYGARPSNESAPGICQLASRSGAAEEFPTTAGRGSLARPSLQHPQLQQQASGQLPPQPLATTSVALTTHSNSPYPSGPGSPAMAVSTATGRASMLMSDMPLLMRKSFSHAARATLQDLHATSVKRPGIDSGGGDAMLTMPYQSNGLYVRSVPYEQAQHEQMLGDEEDPDRPLTRWGRAKLILWGLINPEGRTKWDCFIMLLLIWVCFASPLIICFHLGISLSEGDPVAIVEMVVDACFIADIYLNFRTAYYDAMGNLVCDRSKIARHYFRSWFLYDVMSVIPFDLITEGLMGFLSMLKLLRIVRVGKVLRLMRMYRLLRVTRLPRILERIENYLEKGVLQIAMFALAVGLLAHLSACLFHYMALFTYLLTDTWEGTWVEAQGLVDAGLSQRYINSIYWAFTTVATVGYGDITPKNQKEKVLAILIMCSGVSLVGMVTSSITSIMSIRNAVNTRVAQKKQAVSDVLKSRQIPSGLCRRVRAFFNYESTKLIREEEENLLQDLPFKLRSRFLQHAYMDTLNRLPCFTRLRPDLLIDVISQLRPAYFTDGDIVALQGDLVDETFFVHEGKLELRVYDFPDCADPWAILEAVNKEELAGFQYTIHGRMKKTYYFGHASTVHTGCWPGTVVARNCCELFTLSHDAMQGLAQRHEHALCGLLDVAPPPVPSRLPDQAAFTIDLLQVEIDPDAIAADFPILDAPPRKKGLGQMFVGAVKDVSKGLATLSSSLVSRTVDMMAGGGAGGDGTNTGRFSLDSPSLQHPGIPDTPTGPHASPPQQIGVEVGKGLMGNSRFTAAMSPQGSAAIKGLGSTRAAMGSRLGSLSLEPGAQVESESAPLMGGILRNSERPGGLGDADQANTSQSGTQQQQNRRARVCFSDDNAQTTPSNPQHATTAEGSDTGHTFPGAQESEGQVEMQPLLGQQQ